jgi:hypothetical protein
LGVDNLLGHHSPDLINYGGKHILWARLGAGMLPRTRSYLLKSFVTTVLLGLGLYYLAGFSLRQSAALVILFWLFQFLINDIWIAMSEEKNHGRFLVFIQPNWYQILLDHGLIDGKSDWLQIMERVDEVPRSEYCALRDGIAFTVLDKDLFYLNNERKFVQKIHLDIEVQEIKIPRPNSSLGEPFSPSITVEEIPSFTVGNPTCWDGYEFGLVTPESMKSNLFKGWQEPIKLAFLTVLEFGGYEIRPLGWYTHSKAWRQQQEARTKSLEENGWKRAEKEDGLGRKTSSRVEHRYFMVSHSGI